MLCKTPHPYNNINTQSIEIRPSQRLNNTRPLRKPRFENPIRILEHAVFQTNHNELRALESCLDEAANVLGVRFVERGVDFVEDVHGCWFELEERHDEGEGNERALAAGEFGEGLFPDFAQTDLFFVSF